MFWHSANDKLRNWATSELISGVESLSTKKSRAIFSCGPKTTRTSSGYSSSFNALCSLENNLIQ